MRWRILEIEDEMVRPDLDGFWTGKEGRSPAKAFRGGALMVVVPRRRGEGSDKEEEQDGRWE